VLLTVAILAVPTVVYAWGRSSSSFGISTIRVSGTHLVSARKTLRLLQKTYAGDNLFTVTAEDVRGTLDSQSFVAGVTIDRAFPHTLEVGITEHEPAAYALAGSRWYVIDASGYVVCTAADAAGQLSSGGKKTATTPTPDASASASPDATTTNTTDPTSADDSSGEPGGVTARLVAGPPDAVLPLPRIAVGGRVREGGVLDGEATRQMLTVITALPDSYRRRLAAVENEDGQITLRFEGGPVAAWGDAERTLAKTVALRTVLAEYDHAGKTCAEIDVSLPDRTLAKPVLQ
jgi:cell division septal protein FtsQ